MKIKKGIFSMFLLCAAVVFLMVGCDSNNGTYVKTTEEVTTETTKENWNTQDLSIITGIDKNKKEIAMQSVISGKEYTVYYNNGTSIQNRYGAEMLIDHVLVGEVVDAYYTSGTQKLYRIRESEESWENTTVTKWDVDYDKKLITIGDTIYEYDDQLFIDSDGKEIEINEISGLDQLIVKGIDKKIISIIVSSGHGYIKLTDETNLVGGIVSVGNKIMTVITEDMIIVAPEGEFTLTASKDGVGGSTTVNVKRDEEITVSLSGFSGEVVRDGTVKFTITPSSSNPVLYIDSVKTDYSDLVEVSYGSHVLTVVSDDYDTYQEVFTVDSIYINKAINISGEDETEEETETTTISDSSSDANTVTVSTPVDASVYLDGEYMGKVPISFDKETGSHVLVLRQTGYDSMVYNVTFADDSEDITLTLPELTESE